jgi:hypothetical protein
MAPPTPSNGVPAPNGTFRSFPSMESFDTGSGTSRPFTADTDGGAYRPAFGSGSYPSYPGRAFPGRGASGPQYPSQPPAYPTPDRTNSFPSQPGPNFQPGTNGQPGANGAFQTSYTSKHEAPPSVDVSPMETGQEEFLPIFASVESAWFRKPAVEEVPQSPSRDEATPAQAVPSVEESWRNAADAGWRAAAAASDPSLGGTTSSGLPKRTPKANLVPGTAASQPQQPLRQAPVPPLSADRARSRLASFQQGVRRGRAEVRGQEEQQ